IVARDRPGLLAFIAAALAASRLEVHAAEIHSRVRADGDVEAVDLFWVRDRAEGVDAVERALPKLRRDLDDALTGRRSGAELVERRRSARALWHTPSVVTQVGVDDRGSHRYSIIEVSTRDRPGLLFAISQAIFALGLTIAVAKINTEGTRVADVFYVRDRKSVV